MIGIVRVAVLLVAATACHEDTWLQYAWDDRRVLCSHTIDDLSSDVPADLVAEQIKVAVTHRSAALLHAHAPGRTISMAALQDVLDTAASNGLEFVTFSELTPESTPRAALALCFDDAAVGAWTDIADLLDRYGARVTFFVTRYARWSADEHALLEQLAARGHDVQAHSVAHLNAVSQVEAYGLAAYMRDEALPSIAILEEAGYPVTSYAFPFGASTSELTDAVLEHVERARVSPGNCPH